MSGQILCIHPKSEQIGGDCLLAKTKMAEKARKVRQKIFPCVLGKTLRGLNKGSVEACVRQSGSKDEKRMERHWCRAVLVGLAFRD